MKEKPLPKLGDLIEVRDAIIDRWETSTFICFVPTTRRVYVLMCPSDRDYLLEKTGDLEITSYRMWRPKKEIVTGSVKINRRLVIPKDVKPEHIEALYPHLKCSIKAQKPSK